MTTYAPATAAVPALNSARSLKITFARLVGSELLKIRSLRATAWTVGLMVVSAAGLAVAVGVTTKAEDNATDAGLVLSMTIAVGNVILELVPLVMGALFAGMEYGTGAIRTTLAVAPRRWALLMAKTAATTLVMAVAGLATVGAAYAVLYATFSARGFAASARVDDLVALGGLTLFGVVIGLIGFLIAFAARSVVAGIGFGLGLTTVLPMLAALGKSVPLVATLGDLLPTQAARQMFMAVPGHGGFAGGLGIALIWIVAGLNVTAVLFGRKDA